MITPARDELLDVLRELSDLCPEWRIGQVLTHLATHARGAVPEAVWDAEDEELLPEARRLLEYFRETRGMVA